MPYYLSQQNFAFKWKSKYIYHQNQQLLCTCTSNAALLRDIMHETYLIVVQGQISILHYHDKHLDCSLFPMMTKLLVASIATINFLEAMH